MCSVGVLFEYIILCYWFVLSPDNLYFRLYSNWQGTYRVHRGST